MPGFNISGSSRIQKAHNLGDVIDVHRSHRWRITRVVGEQSFSDHLVYAKEFVPPRMGFDEDVIQGGSIDYKVASKVTYDDVTIVFYDVHKLYDQLYKMHRKIWTPEGGLAPPGNYMGETKLEMTDSRGQPVSSWTLKNSWLKGLDNSPLSYGDTELKTVTAIIAYSWADYEPDYGDSHSKAKSNYNQVALENLIREANARGQQQVLDLQKQVRYINSLPRF